MLHQKRCLLCCCVVSDSSALKAYQESPTSKKGAARAGGEGGGGGGVGDGGTRIRRLTESYGGQAMPCESPETSVHTAGEVNSTASTASGGVSV